MTDKACPFSTLGLPRGAPLWQVKASYHKLVNKFHPDKLGDETPLIREVTNAYRVLSDPDFYANFIFPNGSPTRGQLKRAWENSSCGDPIAPSSKHPQSSQRRQHAPPPPQSPPQHYNEHDCATQDSEHAFMMSKEVRKDSDDIFNRAELYVNHMEFAISKVNEAIANSKFHLDTLSEFAKMKDVVDSLLHQSTTSAEKGTKLMWEVSDLQKKTLELITVLDKHIASAIKSMPQYPDYKTNILSFLSRAEENKTYALSRISEAGPRLQNTETLIGQHSKLQCEASKNADILQFTLNCINAARDEASSNQHQLMLELKCARTKINDAVEKEIVSRQAKAKLEKIDNKCKEEIDKLQTLLHSSQQQCSTLDEEVLNIREQLQNKDAELEKLIKLTNDQLTMSKSEVSTLTTQIHQKMTESDAKFQGLQLEIDRLIAQLSSNMSLSSQIESLSSEVNKRDLQLTTLQEKAKEQKLQMAAHTISLVFKNSVLNKSKMKVAMLEKNVKELESRLVSQTDTTNQLQQDNLSLSAKVVELEKALESALKMHSASEVRDDVYDSNSLPSSSNSQKTQFNQEDNHVPDDNFRGDGMSGAQENDENESVSTDECVGNVEDEVVQEKVRRKREDPDVQCLQCDLILKRSSMSKHRLLHTGVKNKICDICQKRFLRQDNLIAHRKLHLKPAKERAKKSKWSHLHKEESPSANSQQT